MKTRVSLKGQIVLPAELRRRDGIEAGQEFDVAVSISSSGERLP
jgi:AbrB family looped-hinge helix DNA binding protein